MALREILARFGFQIDQRGLAAADKGIAGVANRLRTFGALIGGSLVVRGITNFVSDIVDAGDALGKTSTQLGLSVEQLQSWQALAGYAGVETNNFNQSMRVLQKNTLLASQGSKQAADGFRMLGVDIKDTNGNLKSGNDLMTEVGVALGEMEDSTKRVALAQQLMGRSGAQLLPLFKDGEEGLRKLQARFEEMGGPVGEDFVRFAEDAKDSFQDFSIASSILKSKFAIEFLPVLSQMVSGLSKLIGWVSKALSHTSAFQAVLVVLGGVLAKLAIAKFGGSLLALGKAALGPLAKIFLLVLLVDDLITLFRGGKSAIGEFLDRLFGPGTAAATVKAIKDVWYGVKAAIESGDFEKLDKALEDLFGPPGDALVRFLVDDIPAAFQQSLQEQKTAWSQAATMAGVWLSEVGVALRKGIIEFGRIAETIATAFVDGIVEGIKKGYNAVVGAVKDLAQGALDVAKAVIKPGSPSKVARDEIGKPLAQGMFDVDSAMRAAKDFSRVVQATMPQISQTAAASAPAKGAVSPRGGVIFQSQIDLSVSGGSPSDQQIQKLRQGLRGELTDNRRATLAALTQTVEAT